jgi:hypothetical protein
MKKAIFAIFVLYGKACLATPGPRPEVVLPSGAAMAASVFDIHGAFQKSGFKTNECVFADTTSQRVTKLYRSENLGTCLFENLWQGLSYPNQAPGLVRAKMNLPQDKNGSAPVQVQLKWKPVLAARRPLTKKENDFLKSDWWKLQAENVGHISQLPKSFYDNQIELTFDPPVDAKRILKNDVFARLISGKGKHSILIDRVTLNLDPTLQNLQSVHQDNPTWLVEGNLRFYEPGNKEPLHAAAFRTDWSPLRWKLASPAEIFVGKPWFRPETTTNLELESVSGEHTQ